MTEEQLATVKSNVLAGQPLYTLAVGWSMPEDALLETAGISREDHERRRKQRVVVCQQGLDAAAADRAVHNWAEARARVARPILLLDIDGVINCFGSIWSPEYDAEHFDGGGARIVDEGFAVRVRHATAGMLGELAGAFDIVWCTAWTDRAHPTFQEWLGLPVEPWPHIEFAGAWDRQLMAHEGGSSWKLGHVSTWLETHAADRPVLWLDDDLGAQDYEWAMARTRSALTVLFRTNPSIGLTRELTDGALAFAEQCEVAADFEARMLAETDRLNEMIATCHERRACPKCHAPVGARCVRVGTYEAHGVFPPERALKHPHEERWAQETPRR